MPNSISQPQTGPIADIGRAIQEQLDKFRNNWLPRNKAVRAALATHASGGKQPTRAEYQKIVDGLLEENKFLEKEAFTDPLTGAPNRNAFDSALAHIVSENLDALSAGKKPEELKPTTVVFLDLNYLKQLNHIHFSGGGDAAIKYLTQYVSKKLRKPESHKNSMEGDLFARFGGDEFGIIMKDCPPEDAEKKIRKIVQDMATESICGPNQFIATNKAGVKLPVQVSAAFGCGELIKELPEVDKTGNRHDDIIKISHLSMAKAQNAEEPDKLPSKKFASKVDNEMAMPMADDRDKAENVVWPFLEKKFGEATAAQLGSATQDADPAKQAGKDRHR